MRTLGGLQVEDSIYQRVIEENIEYKSNNGLDAKIYTGICIAESRFRKDGGSNFIDYYDVSGKFKKSYAV